MCSDTPDDAGAHPPKSAVEPRPITAENAADRRTVMLRIRSKNDPDNLIATITASGSKVVSQGHGVIVIEGSESAIDKLRSHPDVIAVDEPKPLQMRRSLKSRKGGDTGEGF